MKASVNNTADCMIQTIIIVYYNNVVVVWLATACFCMGRVRFALINYSECHNKVVK